MSSDTKIKALSKKLESKRKALGLTQVEVADLAGVSARFMYDLERGKPSMSLEKFLAVATTLGLELELKLAGRQYSEN